MGLQSTRFYFSNSRLILFVSPGYAAEWKQRDARLKKSKWKTIFQSTKRGNPPRIFFFSKQFKAFYICTCDTQNFDVCFSLFFISHASFSQNSRDDEEKSMENSFFQWTSMLHPRRTNICAVMCCSQERKKNLHGKYDEKLSWSRRDAKCCKMCHSLPQKPQAPREVESENIFPSGYLANCRRLTS